MSDLVLKPCPLCGIDLFHTGAIELGDIYEHPNNGCALQVAWFTARPEWVEKWNRRADADRIEALERERDARQEDSDSYKASMKTYFGQSLSENNAKVEAQRALAASPSIGRVGVKPLEWKEEVRGTWWTADAYRIELFDGGGFASRVADPGSRAFRTLVFGVSLDAAKAAAQAAHEARILSTLVYHEEPAGDTQGALAVRPLKWEPSGRYPFVAMSDYYDIGHQSGDGRYWVHHRIFGDLREGDGTIEHHLTLDAAKAAAQEDHERKILWQIVGSSDPDVAPPNVEHLHPLADREKSAALVSPPDNGEPTEAEIDDAVRCIGLGVSAGIADTVNVGAALRRFVAGRAALQSHNEGSE